MGERGKSDGYQSVKQSGERTTHHASGGKAKYVPTRVPGYCLATDSQPSALDSVRQLYLKSSYFSRKVASSDVADGRAYVAVCRGADTVDEGPESYQCVSVSMAGRTSFDVYSLVVGDGGGSLSSGTVALTEGATGGTLAFDGGSSSEPSRDERKPPEEVSDSFAPLTGVGSSGSSAAAEDLEGRVGGGAAGSSTSCRMRRAGIFTNVLS